jgi:UDP-glucose 4-epimerase
MKVRNVLVTGASTPLGERLIETMLDDSRIGQILAVSDKGRPLTIPDTERLASFELELRKQRRLHDLLFGPAKDRRIDVLIHTSLISSANREGAAVHAHNVDALRAILDFAERHPTISQVVIRSSAGVYQVQRDLPALIGEDHPLNMNSGAPQWVRDRVESDVTACTRMGLSPLRIVVLRMAEILCPGCGSQVFDYLQSPICLRPIGYDPMLNFLTVEDAVASILLSVHGGSQGVFNIPGADTLPLSATIAKWGRLGLPLPEPAIGSLYKIRRRLRGGEFRYGMNRRRFHYSGILDGKRAEEALQYIPSHPIEWPVQYVTSDESG